MLRSPCADFGRMNLKPGSGHRRTREQKPPSDYSGAASFTLSSRRFAFQRVFRRVAHRLPQRNPVPLHAPHVRTLKQGSQKSGFRVENLVQCPWIRLHSPPIIRSRKRLQTSMSPHMSTHVRAKGTMRIAGTAPNDSTIVVVAQRAAFLNIQLYFHAGSG